ncbi:MAG: DUF3177 family protein [Leptolyngbyaceae cyanobacterium CSU_1_3]|nr:DUF3177 family protein [Leptolyngbyaceae cyanobacterium CSU_1_3]
MPDVPTWIASLVWTDYRLAVLLTVIVPLILLIWAFTQQVDALQRLLIIYWRVSSLLAITVYLLIGALPIGFVSGWLARILIPIALWYWADLNEEIREQSTSPLKIALTAWRWGVSVYCAVGVLAQLPFLRCATLTTSQLQNDAACRLWLEPPWAYREFLHSTTQPWFLGFLGIGGLIVYTLYLGYFVFFRVGKRKRSAMGN